MIADLEQENKALNAKNAQMPAQIDEMRRRMADEMKNYKDQSEYSNSKNVGRTGSSCLNVFIGLTSC